MAKANGKAKNNKMAGNLKKGFQEYEDVYNMLTEQAEQMGMVLLSKSLELSKAILQTYKKAYMFRIKEDGK